MTDNAGWLLFVVEQTLLLLSEKHQSLPWGNSLLLLRVLQTKSLQSTRDTLRELFRKWSPQSHKRYGRFSAMQVLHVSLSRCCHLSYDSYIHIGWLSGSRIKISMRRWSQDSRCDQKYPIKAAQMNRACLMEVKCSERVWWHYACYVRTNSLQVFIFHLQWHLNQFSLIRINCLMLLSDEELFNYCILFTSGHPPWPQ